MQADFCERKNGNRYDLALRVLCACMLATAHQLCMHARNSTSTLHACSQQHINEKAHACHHASQRGAAVAQFIV
jgi:hypothetical protein